MAVSGISGNIAGNAGGISKDAAARAVTQSNDAGFEAKLKAAIEKNDQKELKNVCKQFEGIMLDIMFKSMKATINKSDLITEDPGTEIFQEMLDEKMMEEASKISTFGLADSLYKQLSKQTSINSMQKSLETSLSKKDEVTSEEDFGTEATDGKTP